MDIDVYVADLMGRKVYESMEKNIKDLTKTINVKGLARGDYIVSLRTPSGVQSQKIIVK